MKIYRITEALEELCIKSKQWVIYVSWDDEFNVDEVQKAIPFLTIDDLLLNYGEGVIFCNSQEEAYRLFDQIIGDDGPTESNKYNGYVRIYASTIGPYGFETENT